jgi:4-hydroxy-3-methylbut-2-en-1-yl diphosphate reductase
MNPSTIFAPTWLEARQLRHGLKPGRPGTPKVVCTGMGAERAGAAGGRDGPAAVAGICRGLRGDLRPGDVVVADRVYVDPLARGPAPAPIRMPAAELLAGELRRRGLRVHVGPVVGVRRLVQGADADRLGAMGALGADQESPWLLDGRSTTPLACVRVVADTVGDAVLRPSMLDRLRTGLRSLPPVAEALTAWAAATTPRRVVLASPRAFCAGVQRAVAIVDEALRRHGAPVYVRKQIVHNVHVVTALRERGAVFVDELDEIPDGAVTIFSAHGVAPSVRATAARRGLTVVDATCPLVAKVHAEARRFAGRGHTVLLIGHAGHEETQGTLGEAPQNIQLVQDLADAERVTVDDPERVSYLLQTTLATDETDAIVNVLSRRFPALAAPPSDDICYATTNRQRAVRAVAAESDVVLVLGSANSSNSVRLLEVARRAGAAAYLVDDVSDVDLSWLAGVRTIGVTAGASAPPELADRLVEALSGVGVRQVDEHVETVEDIQFTLPREVRPR